MSRIRRLFKEVPQVLDRARVLGGAPAKPTFRGMRMPDGSPVSVETIMQAYNVPRDQAETIAARNQ